MTQARFTQRSADTRAFIRIDEHTVIIAVYIDDLILNRCYRSHVGNKTASV